MNNFRAEFILSYVRCLDCVQRLGIGEGGVFVAAYAHLTMHLKETNFYLKRKAN
jgi:hypothetical protein